MYELCTRSVFSICVPPVTKGLLVHYFTRGTLITLFGADEAESREALEVSGPSHRIGLSGANKTMLHLLKKAKVQLIKIDQQKQLKLSQVRNKDQICAI